MAYVIPDVVLQHQVCSVCKLYLSYTPTKIYRSGEIKCGRCSNPGDEGVVSTFETIAKNLLFPCVNRFDGCTRALHYKDVKEHENTCVGSVVECPICLGDELSLLGMVHHFKIKHPKQILNSCEIDVSLLNRFNKYFLKYDFETSRIFVIVLNWDTKNLSVKCATITENKDGKIASKIQVSYLTVDERQECLYSSDFRDCLDLKNYRLDPVQQGFTCILPMQLEQLRCKLVFNSTLQFLKIEQFLSNRDTVFKKKVWPKMYLDSEFKEKYKDLDLVKFKLFFSERKIQNNSSLQMACDFCGNFFTSSGFIKDIFCDNDCYICGTCYSRGITKNLKNNGSDLHKPADIGYHLLNFYCKFDCKKFFRSGELLSHEDQCILNKHRSFTEEDYVKSHFGVEYVAGSKFSRENIIVYEPHKFKNKGNIFVATREHFKCVIDYEQDSKFKLCVFRINHKYDTKKYYISVHKWENNTFSTDYNDFSMKNENCNGSSIFAFNLQEVQEDLKLFCDA